MSMTDDIDRENVGAVWRGPLTAADAMSELKSGGGLDALFAMIDSGQVDLAGDGGFVSCLIKTALERGLHAELSADLGYEKGDLDARWFCEFAQMGRPPRRWRRRLVISSYRSRGIADGTFTPRLVPKGIRRLGGLDDMIVSLYASDDDGRYSTSS